jgi:hypothetical protein
MSRARSFWSDSNSSKYVMVRTGPSLSIVRGFQSSRSWAREIGVALAWLVLRPGPVNNARVRAGQIDHHCGQFYYREFRGSANIHRTSHKIDGQSSQMDALMSPRKVRRSPRISQGAGAGVGGGVRGKLAVELGEQHDAVGEAKLGAGGGEGGIFRRRGAVDDGARARKRLE